MKDFEKYEELVSSLAKTKIMEGIPSNKYEIYRQKKYIGKSGQSYIVDVSIELDLNGLKYITVIECKNYNKKVSVGVINELFGRLNDIGAHKGVVVTTKGFQKGVIQTAKSYKIGCVIANDLVWIPLIGDLSFIYVQTKNLDNYFKKTTNKPLPKLIKDNISLFLQEFNSTNGFCETNINGFGNFIGHGYTFVDENEPSFTLSANGLINLLILNIASSIKSDM
jgi:hypothetical protein